MDGQGSGLGRVLLELLKGDVTHRGVRGAHLFFFFFLKVLLKDKKKVPCDDRRQDNLFCFKVGKKKEKLRCLQGNKKQRMRFKVAGT